MAQVFERSSVKSFLDCLLRARGLHHIYNKHIKAFKKHRTQSMRTFIKYFKLIFNEF